MPVAGDWTRCPKVARHFDRAPEPDGPAHNAAACPRLHGKDLVRSELTPECRLRHYRQAKREPLGGEVAEQGAGRRATLKGGNAPYAAFG